MKFLIKMLLASFAIVPLVDVAKAADYSAPPPPAPGGFYVRGDVGGSYLDWSTASQHWAFVGDLGAGYQFTPNFRSDVTWNYAGNYTVNPGASLQTSIVLGNIYYDWKNDSPFTPYVGAGIGYGWQYSNNSAISANSGLALGLAAGVSYDMTNNLAVDVGYRFHDIVSSGGSTPVPEHQATIGLRVKF